MNSVIAPAIDFYPEQIADPTTYGDPERLHRLYAWLRSEAPVVMAKPEGYRPFWVITRYDDVREIERQASRFVAETRVVLLTEETEKTNLKYLGTINGSSSLVSLDGEKHRKLRAITQEWFMPKNINTLREKITALAELFVDRLIATGGQCDFCNDIAFWYPLRVATTALGLPPEDEPHLMRLTQEIFGFQDEEFQRPGGADKHLVGVMTDFTLYFDKVTADRRANPRDDVSTLIANALVDGADLDPRDRLSYYIIVATAGHDTTSSSICGGMLALIRSPGQWEKLRADPDLCKPLADEAIRYSAAVKHFMRTATEDYVLRGQTIKRGDNILLAFDAACRDPEVFPNPDEFIIDRRPNVHMAFGYGPHTCLGQYLAKMEIEIFFRELSKRIKSFELAGEVEFSESSFVSGVKRMPVRFNVA